VRGNSRKASNLRANWNVPSGCRSSCVSIR
jgi:hypothetical protein